jgi:hypothetical protein
MAKKLCTMLRRYLPNAADGLLEAQSRDDELAAMLDDLVLADEALGHWRSSPGPVAADRVREYEELVADLLQQLQLRAKAPTGSC